MNPIKSNYEGRHIHSPFAFHLVSEVIFDRSGSRSVVPSENFGHLGTVWPKLELIIRLMKYFMPENIFVSGRETGNIENVIEEYYKPVKPVHVSVGHKHPEQNIEFVIWTECLDVKEEIADNISESVWFLFDIQQNDMRDFFDKLKLNVKVTQTYELNSCGIVIFNPKFQKQDFVIKGKKSY